MVLTASARVCISSPVLTSTGALERSPLAMPSILLFTESSGITMRLTNFVITSAPPTKLIAEVMIIISSAMEELPRNSLASQLTSTVQSVPTMVES